MESLAKNPIVLSLFFVFMMNFAFVGLLGAITRHLLMPPGYSLGFKEYKGVHAVIWGVIFFIGISIFPLLIFWVITRDKLSTEHGYALLFILLALSFVAALFTKKWILLSRQTNFSGAGINWKYKVIMLVFVTILFSAISIYPVSILSIVLTLLLFVSGITLPLISLFATWWLFTLGGRLPLPQQHAWLAPNKKASQIDYFRSFGAIFPSIIAITLLMQTLPFTNSFLILKPISWFLLFHLGVTITAVIKGRKFAPNR